MDMITSLFSTWVKDLEFQLFVVIAAIPPVLMSSRLTWSNVTFYFAIVVSVWFVNRCSTPPKHHGGDGKTQITIDEQITVAEGGSTQTDTKKHEILASDKIKLIPERNGVGAANGVRDHPKVTTSDQPRDGLKWVAQPVFFNTVKSSLTIIGLYHAILILAFPLNTSSTLCPHPKNLDPQLFTWTSQSCSLSCSVSISACLRLLSYHQLGENFTFNIKPPSRLTTTGLYAYIQHPSYTFGILALLLYSFLFLSPGGVIACWSEVSVDETSWWKVMSQLWYVLVLGGFIGLAGRILAEEAILKKEFGREWEVWSRKTKRLVPGVW